MAKRPELLIETGELKGKRYTVTEAGLRLGRSSSNDLHVADEELSRNHCLFEPDGAEGIRVVDLASANGTYVNSVQLAADPKPLKPGDIVIRGYNKYLDGKMIPNFKNNIIGIGFSHGAIYIYRK